MFDRNINRLLQAVFIITYTICGCNSTPQRQEPPYSGWGSPLISRVAQMDFDTIEAVDSNFLLMGWNSTGVLSCTENGLINTAKPAFLANELPKELFGQSTAWRHISDNYDGIPGGSMVVGLEIDKNRLSGICYTSKFSIEPNSSFYLEVDNCFIRPINIEKQPILQVANVTNMEKGHRFSLITSKAINIKNFSFVLIPTSYYGIIYGGKRDPDSIGGCNAYYVVPLNTYWVFRE